MAKPIKEQPLDDLIDFYRRTRAAQRLAEREGLLGAAATLGQAAETVLREFGWDSAVILCLTAGPTVPPVGLLPIHHEARH